MGYLFILIHNYLGQCVPIFNHVTNRTLLIKLMKPLSVRADQLLRVNLSRIWLWTPTGSTSWWISRAVDQPGHTSRHRLVKVRSLQVAAMSSGGFGAREGRWQPPTPFSCLLLELARSSRAAPSRSRRAASWRRRRKSYAFLKCGVYGISPAFIARARLTAY